jgi:hypothetical protein
MIERLQLHNSMFIDVVILFVVLRLYPNKTPKTFLVTPHRAQMCWSLSEFQPR